MTLADIATVSGKGGLYKVLAPTKSGVILESLDEARTKMVATSNHRLSLLHEISIYTTTREGNIPLHDVLKKVQKDFGDDPGVDANSDSDELRAFMKSVLPEYDESRVYTSDIKKLVKWYGVIRKYAPEVIAEAADNEAKDKKGKKEKKDKTDKTEKPAKEQDADQGS